MLYERVGKQVVYRYGSDRPNEIGRKWSENRQKTPALREKDRDERGIRGSREREPQMTLCLEFVECAWLDREAASRKAETPLCTTHHPRKVFVQRMVVQDHGLFLQLLLLSIVSLVCTV